MEGRNKVANPHAGRMRLPLCGHGKGKSCTVLTRVSGGQLSLQNTTEVTSLRQWASSYLLFCSVALWHWHRSQGRTGNVQAHVSQRLKAVWHSAHPPSCIRVADTPAEQGTKAERCPTLSAAVSSFSSGFASGFASTRRFQRSSCTMFPSSTCDKILDRGSSV